VHGTVHDIDGGRGRAAIKLQAKSDLLHCHGRRRRSADSSSRSKPERGPGQTACPLARPERKRPQNAPKSGAVGTSRSHRKSLQTAEFSADGCLDRTQEVGGSSPPSSTRRPPAHVGVSSFGGLRAPGNRIAWAVGCRLSASSVRRVRPPRTVAVASHHSIRMTRRPIRRGAGRRCATGMSRPACLPRAGVRPPFRVTTDRGMRSAPITSSSVVGGRAAASGRQTK